MENTDIDLVAATANMTAAESEAYFKSLPTETIVEPVIEEPKVETPKVVEKAEEVVIPKDKLEQKAKIGFSQARMWKAQAEAKDKEIAELKSKIESWERENNMEAQSELLDKIVEAKLAKMNLGTSQDTEKTELLKSFPTETDLLPEYEAIIKENPLSLAQARTLYQAENPIVTDPTAENRERLARQATPGMPISSEEKPLENASSDEIAKAGKALLASGKINNYF